MLSIAPSHLAPAQPGLTWSVVGDLQGHEKTNTVLSELKKLEPLMAPEDSFAQFVCLESPSRQPILTISVTGDLGWHRLTSLLESLGLEDRLKHQLFHSDPYDAVFS